jgi:hypothetical protein
MSHAPPSRRRARPTFRPQFTLLILYFAGVFMALALLFVLPDLLSALGELPARGPLSEQDLARAREVARESLRGNVLYVFFLAVAVTGILAWFRRLPGVTRH